MDMFFGLVVICYFIRITLSIDCKYFTSPNFGPYVPIDVCSQYQIMDTESKLIIQGSYQFECFHDKVVAHYWADSIKCDGEIEFLSDPYLTDNKQCTGHICDYVTLRSYPQLSSKDSCQKDDQNYFEYALVTECWHTYENTQKSRSLSCNEDSFTLNYYESPDCDERNLTHAESITSGCKWFLNGTISDNQTIPFINKTLSWSGNDTYFEITACGGTINLLWLYLALPVGGFCCICCFTALVCQKCRGKPASSDGYIQSV
eukprot:509073_1